MKNREELAKKIKKLEQISENYEDKAFFHELKRMMDEQSIRIEQAEGEIDGRLWSPKNW
ncbi:hypothetical protein ACFFIF_02240 [Vagococcus entomophilus]|uniref:hypothetical protein n=1 Tax=Vagococcus entomophilus TaxID=1160095 RepID=UPI001474C26C|nr:hypothetical protein [Vagococcus entomophilus]